MSLEINAFLSGDKCAISSDNVSKTHLLVSDQYCMYAWNEGHRVNWDRAKIRTKPVEKKDVRGNVY